MTTKRVLHYRVLADERLRAFARSQVLTETMDRIYMEMTPEERSQLAGRHDDDPTVPDGGL